MVALQNNLLSKEFATIRSSSSNMAFVVNSSVKTEPCMCKIYVYVKNSNITLTQVQQPCFYE